MQQQNDTKWGYDREAFYKKQQALSELEARRVAAYEEAADCEAQIQYIHKHGLPEEES